MASLTLKQERFCSLYHAAGQNREEALRCAREAGYQHKAGRQAVAAALGNERVQDELARLRGEEPAPGRGGKGKAIKANQGESGAPEGAPEEVNAEWVLNEAAALYVKARDANKMSLAKSLLDLIGKHKDIDAFAKPDMNVNVFSADAEKLLIQGRQRALLEGQCEVIDEQDVSTH